MVEIRGINAHITIGLLDLSLFSQQKGGLAKRELEKAGTRFLLEQLLKSTDFELCYTAQNKPYLNGQNRHISISHSHDKLAIIVNEKENTGIDIEQIRDKVQNIQQKFLNPQELAFAANDTSKLITLWAAKEAMYKVYGLKELEFIGNLFVDAFTGSELSGRIETGSLKKSYRLQSEEIDGYKLVYVLHEL